MEDKVLDCMADGECGDPLYDEDDDDLSAYSIVDWNLLTFCTTLILIALFLLSLLLNLSTACVVCSRSKLRRYGYFHQVVVFCVLHTAYFGLKTAKFVLESLTVTSLLPQELYAGVITTTQWGNDALLCLFGANMLVLTSMSTDNLIMASTNRRSGGGGSPIARCSRVTLLATALLTGAAAFFLALFFKFGTFAQWVDQPLDRRDSLLVVYGVYLVCFALVPAVFIVIFGTVNWVAETNSSRVVKTPRQVARSLDHQLLLTSVAAVLLFLVVIVLDFHLALDAFPNDQDSTAAQLAAYTIWLCADFFYGLYALVLAFALGRFCLCCKCCCDDEDDWVYDY